MDGAPEKALGKRISHLVSKEDVRCGKEFETGLVGLVTHVVIDLIDEKRFVKSSEQERLGNVNYVAACDHAKNRVPVPPPQILRTLSHSNALYCIVLGTAVGPTPKTDVQSSESKPVRYEDMCPGKKRES